MTGFSINQFASLVVHLRIPSVIRDLESRRTFEGVEAFLRYLIYNRLGETKLQMSLYYFGGDPRGFHTPYVPLEISCMKHFIIRCPATLCHSG